MGSWIGMGDFKAVLRAQENGGGNLRSKNTVQFVFTAHPLPVMKQVMPENGSHDMDKIIPSASLPSVNITQAA
ncbi:hypothetical protein VNO80_22206 [Phaseolus coccineus]|uniref:Uncharacterized protein n=1 Tax=Phaseolus coccineus TaxID=3886 RepID=A0AAN9M4N3_PHACN